MSFNDSTFSADGNSKTPTKKSVKKLIEEKNELYRQTRLLLRQTLQATQTLELLPPKAFIHVQLAYYEDITPPNYHPPGYEECPVESSVKNVPEDAIMTTCAAKTPHHALKVKIVSKCFGQESASSQRSIFDTPSQGVNVSSAAGGDMADDVSCQGPVYDCPCVMNREIATDEVTLVCERCGSLQHGICHLIFNDEQKPENHHCASCAVERGDPKLCADRQVARLMKKDQLEKLQPTCIFRRVLALCASLYAQGQPITPETLERAGGFSFDLASKSFNKLVAEGIVDEDTGEIDGVKFKKSSGPDFLGANASVLYAGFPDAPTTPAAEAAHETDDPIPDLEETTKNLRIFSQKKTEVKNSTSEKRSREEETDADVEMNEMQVNNTSPAPEQVRKKRRVGRKAAKMVI